MMYMPQEHMQYAPQEPAQQSFVMTHGLPQTASYVMAPTMPFNPGFAQPGATMPAPMEPAAPAGATAPSADAASGKKSSSKKTKVTTKKAKKGCC